MSWMDTIMATLFDNVFLLVVIGLVVYFLYYFLRIRKKMNIHVIERSELERQKFIEDMKYNISSKFKWLIKEGKVIGKIVNYIEASVIGNPEEFTVTKMVFKPTFQWKKIKLVKFWAKLEGLMLINRSQDSITKNNEPILKEIDALELKMLEVAKRNFKEGNIKFSNDEDKKAWDKLFEEKKKNEKKLLNAVFLKRKDEIIVSEGAGLENYIGLYYDMTTPTVFQDNVINSRLLKSDIDQLASRYFAVSQQQCVYSPELAHQLAMKERELQIELAKRKGKLSEVT